MRRFLAAAALVLLADGASAFLTQPLGTQPLKGLSHGASKATNSRLSAPQPLLRPARAGVRGSAPEGLRMQIAAAAGQTLFGSQAATLEKIKQARFLEAKDYPAECGFAQFSLGDAQGTMSAFEAPGKYNVAWTSSLNLASPSLCISSLTTWCGPLMEVPHLVTRTVATDQGVDLFIDFRPRAYAAYETRLDDGSYGEPDSREWFSFKTARDGFAELFFTPEIEGWAASIRGQGAPKPKASGDDLLYRGPLTIDITLPPSDASLQLAAQASAQAADIWLGWMDNTPPLPAGMKVTSTYAYDTKMRAQMFGVMVDYYSQFFGPDAGRALAAADAGPLDEAYVGGAS